MTVTVREMSHFRHLFILNTFINLLGTYTEKSVVETCKVIKTGYSMCFNLQAHRDIHFLQS